MHAISGIPKYHLDQLYWRPGWVETDKPSFTAKVLKIITSDAWIIDGNYSTNVEQRMARADTIVMTDIPTWKAIYRVIKRRFQYKGETRPDMTEGCVEKIDWEFIHYVLMYNRTRRPGNLRRIERFCQDKRVYVLKNEHDKVNFLNDYRQALLA